MTALGDDPARAAVVQAAASRLELGMTLGLGSARAVWALLEVLASRWAGRSTRVAVASSATEARATAAGFEVVSLDGGVTLDVVVDGADQVDPDRNLIKGHGAALLREKLVVAAARRFLVVAERSKLVDRLGEGMLVPVEVVRFAWPETRRRLLDLVPAATLRRDRDGAALVTDEANHILDCALPPVMTWRSWRWRSRRRWAWSSTGCSPAWPTRSSLARPTAASRRSPASKVHDPEEAWQTLRTRSPRQVPHELTEPSINCIHASRASLFTHSRPRQLCSP